MKERININTILESIMILGGFYLVGCFIEVSFDIKEWHPVSRMILSVIGLYTVLVYHNIKRM